MIQNDISKGETLIEWPVKSATNNNRDTSLFKENRGPVYNICDSVLHVENEVVYSSFSSPYPCIEMRKFTSGFRPVIRGTRISVADIVGYLKLGESPKTIAGDILPIDLVQLFEAVQYYAEHKIDIEREIAENNEEIDNKNQKP